MDAGRSAGPTAKILQLVGSSSHLPGGHGPRSRAFGRTRSKFVGEVSGSWRDFPWMTEKYLTMVVRQYNHGIIIILGTQNIVNQCQSYLFSSIYINLTIS